MDLEVYCDESRQELFRSPTSGKSYVLIGGIWIKAEDRRAHKEAIKEVRARHRARGEFKWNRVSQSRIEFYAELVQIFFSREIRFRTLVLRADELDAIRFHQSDNELMFYKFYYQLLHHWILDRNTYRVFVDTKTNRLHDRLATLEQCLRNSNLSSEVKVQALPSQQVDLIQLADVLIGAVSYKFHERQESSAKKRIVAVIEEKLGHEIRPTSRSENKFNVFRFRSEGGW